MQSEEDKKRVKFQNSVTMAARESELECSAILESLHELYVRFLQKKENCTCKKCKTEDTGKKFFKCPNCGSVLCDEEHMPDFNDNYCGYCGNNIISAREKALALIKDNN